MRLEMKNSKKLKPGLDYIGVGGGALIVNDKNQVLLLKRNSGARNDAGCWNKPGGTLEFGEAVEDMIKRECKEEAGVEIEIIKFLSFTDHLIKSENQHWISFNYLAKIKSGEPINLETDKHDGIEWFSIDNLPENISQPTLESIEIIRND